VTVLADTVHHTSNDTLLITAALLGIATVVVLIVWLKVHPFVSLIIGSAVLGVVAGVSALDIITSFTTGLGATTGSVGLLIALGAMIGGLLTASGGADRIVNRIVDRVSPRSLPWAMGGVAALIGIPLFFEIGVVLLIPIVLLVARRSRQPVLRVGIPALAGLSVLHGFIPPHPGPLVAISSLNADLGLVLLFGPSWRSRRRSSPARCSVRSSPRGCTSRNPRRWSPPGSAPARPAPPAQPVRDRRTTTAPGSTWVSRGTATTGTTGPAGSRASAPPCSRSSCRSCSC
jgi:MFS family permease